MLIEILKSKLQDGYITESREDYEGSVRIDEEIMLEMGLVTNEVVEINSLEFNARHLTYVIPGPAGSKEISVRGALAQYFKRGDRVHLNCFCYMTQEEACDHKPVVVKTNVWVSKQS